MRSIKFKFTIFVVVAIAIVVLIFSAIMFTANIGIQNREFTDSLLQELAEDRPALLRFIRDSGTPGRLIELSKVVSASAAADANNRLTAAIPFIMGLAGIIGFLVASILVSPIEKLSLLIKELGSKNLSSRLPETQSSTEIEELTQRINLLLDELEQAFKVQEQFVGDAAHELRTPLAAMKAQIEVNKTSKSSHSVEFVETIERLNNQMISLNEKLLYLNRSQHKQSTQAVDVGSVIEDVIEIVQAKHPESNLRIRFVAPSQRTKLMIDAGDLNQVVRNLLENAIKYTDNLGGQISDSDSSELDIVVKLESNKKMTTISVADRGIGIPKAELHQIFDRFYRASNAAKRATDGEGLGLAIVSKVVKAYGGTISVESKLGHGTIFKISFPSSH